MKRKSYRSIERKCCQHDEHSDSHVFRVVRVAFTDSKYTIHTRPVKTKTQMNRFSYNVF